MSSASKDILGNSKPVIEMLGLIKKVSQTKTNVLVIGESGTGKELVARKIHDSGPLKQKPFIPVNCGAIPENLIESEMFGHKRGSFTGAVSDKAGLFEAATGGTLFLDEVGELPLGMQVKLLRAIQERVIRRVGSNEDVKVDVRIIAATNRNLEQAVQKGTFREDLYYRLNVILIQTPPLRDRQDDILLLANFFVKQFNEKQHKKIKGLSPEVTELFKQYTWPGNIRELENTIERAVTLENDEWIGTEVLPPEWLATAAQLTKRTGVKVSTGANGWLTLEKPNFAQGPVALESILDEVEKRYLLEAMDYCQGVKKKASEQLSITFRSLRYRLKKLGLDAGPDLDDDESE